MSRVGEWNSMQHVTLRISLFSKIGKFFYRDPKVIADGGCNQVIEGT